MKIDQIKSKILETSRTSTLINYTKAKCITSIELLVNNSDEFVNQLINEYVFDINNNSQYFTTDLSKDELNSKLDKIYERYMEINNELSINSLYISVGLLHWSDSDENEMNSPIILIPIYLKRSKIGRSDSYSYKFYLSEESPTLNISLIQKLKEEKVKLDFGELNNLSNVSDYIENINNEFGNESKFSISLKVILGIFYNPRMNIYKDFEENEDKIVKHPIIMAISGNQSKIIPLDIKKSKVDDELSYKNNCLVVSADSSQLRAINEVSKGKSLVIQGPPGTGKSQTITNIIANAIANNKSVLFVAEKQAALSVVNRNLKKANLSDACLYFDSNKVSRKVIYNDIYETLMKNPTTLNEEATKVVEQLDILKAKFDKHCDELHQIIPEYGMSVYQLFCEYIKYSDEEYMPDLIDDISKVNIDELNRRINYLNLYNHYLDELNINNYQDHFFYGFNNKSLTLLDKEDILKSINKILSSSIDCAYTFINELKMRNIYQIFDLFTNLPTYFNEKWLDTTNIIIYYNNLQDYFEKKAKYEKAKSELDKYFMEEIYNQTIVESLHKVPSMITQNALKLYSKDIKANTKLLKRLLQNRKTKLTKENVVAYTRMIKEVSNLDIYLKANIQNIEEITSSNQVNLEKLLEEVIKVKNITEEVKEISQIYKNYFTNDNKEINNSIYDNVKEYYKCLENLNKYYDINIIDFTNMSINELNTKISKATIEIDSLSTYINLMNEMALEKSLNQFIDQAFKNNIERKDLANIYKKNYFVKAIDYALEKTTDLKEFSSIKYEEERERFIRLDEDFQVISMAKAREAASNKKPIANNQSTKSDVGVLKIQKEKPTLYIKEMFSQIKRSILRIKPVMLMSPLAVSKYLPGDLSFDIVIFDEASQIQPEDAICSIYRAKQVVVVGDNKQLPPTDFFKKVVHYENENMKFNEEDITLVGSSLLDLCNTFLESVNLSWHYRSQNEELITFSNHYIYDDKLVTFPSPIQNKEDFGIEFYQTLDATYAKGTSRINKVEASKVVDLIIENIEKYPNRSLGVISFSLVQRNEINRQLEKHLKEINNDNYERYEKLSSILYNEDTFEPFFIKNLENVQGDERDTIIFSIGYGHDTDNKLTYNLGKLTREEGRKRINVATSRSKINMKVVCSFEPEEIKITNTEQIGLLALKQFIQYAKTKTSDEFKNDSLYFKEDNIALNIKEYFENKGYRVAINFGKSNNRIDVAISKEKSKDIYNLAIILDGHNYYECQSVRDREKLKETLLEKLGWNIIRVYASDFVKNKQTILDKITKILENPSDNRRKIKIEDLGIYEDIKLNQSETIQERKTIAYEDIIKELPSIEGYNAKFMAIAKKIIEEQGPIHVFDISSIIYPFFEAPKLSEHVYNLVKEKMENFYNIMNVKKDSDFYMPYGINQFAFKKMNKKRTLSRVYYLELANLILKIVEKSSGIYIDSLYKDVLRSCNYSENELELTLDNDKNQFMKAYNYLVENNLIEIESNLIYKK